MKNIEYKFKVNNTVMSFWKGTNGKTIVFASGLPQYVTSYHPIVSTFLSLGYNLLIPKYQGTWESSGTFQIKTSVESVDNALRLVHFGKAIELFNNTEIEIPNKNIILVGFSYGGLISLFSKISVNKKILLMPFLNLEFHGKKKFEMELLFIERAYHNVYKFHKTYFLSELTGLKYPKTINNLSVVFGKKDKSVSKEEIDWFLKKYNPNVTILNLPHTANLSLSQFKKIL